MELFSKENINIFIRDQEEIIKQRIKILNNELPNERIQSYWGKVRFAIQILCKELHEEAKKKIDGHKLEKFIEKNSKNLFKEYKKSIESLMVMLSFIPNTKLNKLLFAKVGVSKDELKSIIIRLFSIDDNLYINENKISGRSSTPEPIIKFIFELSDICMDITGKKPVIYRDRRLKNNSFGLFYDFFYDCYPNLIFKKIFPAIRSATIIDIFKKYKTFKSYLEKFEKEQKKKYRSQTESKEIKTLKGIMATIDKSSKPNKLTANEVKLFQKYANKIK